MIRAESANVPEVHLGECGTESDRRTFNERATPETGIDVTLDYLNGADPQYNGFSLFLMFHPHKRRARIANETFQSDARRFGKGGAG